MTEGEKVMQKFEENTDQGLIGQNYPISPTSLNPSLCKMRVAQICSFANYLVSLPKIENIMPYTITIADNNPQALHLVRYLKTLDFVKVTKQKEPKYSQEVLDASKVLK